MAVSLKKNEGVSLAKIAPSLSNAIISIGWEKSPMDLDVQCFMLGSDDKVLSDDHFIFYGKKVSDCGNIKHTGDSRNGAAEGADENILVKLQSIDPAIKKLAFTVSIDKAEELNHYFGKLREAYASLIDGSTEKTLLTYDLDEDAADASCMIFCEVYRQPDNEWNFKAIGNPIPGGLEGACRKYGVNV